MKVRQVRGRKDFKYSLRVFFTTLNIVDVINQQKRKTLNKKKKNQNYCCTVCQESPTIKEEYDMATNNKCIVIVSLTHSHCPVYAQVQRDQDEVIEEKVDSLCPALHCSVSSHLSTSSVPQLGEEEGAERVNL